MTVNEMSPGWGCFACSSTWLVISLSLFLPLGFLILIIPIFSHVPLGMESEQLDGCLAARWDQPPQQSTSLKFFTLVFPVFVTLCYYRKSIITWFFHSDLPYSF